MSVPTIIDTDPGVDDAVALMLAAASPELQLLAVTTVFGNASVEVSTANACGCGRWPGSATCRWRSEPLDHWCIRGRSEPIRGMARTALGGVPTCCPNPSDRSSSAARWL